MWQILWTVFYHIAEHRALLNIEIHTKNAVDHQRKKTKQIQIQKIF